MNYVRIRVNKPLRRKPIPYIHCLGVTSEVCTRVLLQKRQTKMILCCFIKKSWITQGTSCTKCTFHVGHQLLHSWHVPSGAGHVQWGDSLAVLGPHIYGLTPHRIPICQQQQLDQLAASGLCLRGSLPLHVQVTASWEVTRCEV